MDSTNTTLTFNITLAPSYADDGTVTVYRVSFNTTANGTDTPQVTAQQYGTVRANLGHSLCCLRWPVLPAQRVCALFWLVACTC